jgi:hypothetical protein
MKKQKIIITGIIVFFLFSVLLNTVLSYNEFNDSENFENIILDFTFSKPKIEEIEQKNEIYYRVSIDNLPNSGDLKRPCLPVKSVKILLPYGREFDTIYVRTDNKMLLKSDCKIEIGQNTVPIKSALNQQLDSEDLSDKSSKNIYSIVGTYKFRGFQILFVNLYPVEYDEISRNIYYYQHITIKVATKEALSIAKIRGLHRDKDAIISIIDNPSCFTSYDSVYKSAKEDTANYIIITNNVLANSGLEDNFQYFAQSKINKGITTEIFTVEEIINNFEYGVNGTWGDNNPSNPFYESEIIENYHIFDDNQAKIRNFIRYAYMELETDYVLLGGDGDITNEDDNIIPCRGLFANESGLPLKDTPNLNEEEDDIPSDVYYACLDGNFNYDLDGHFGECADRNDIAFVDEADLLAEVYVGRACVDSEEEVANFVMKTLGYENSDGDPYLSKILFVGEYLGFPGVSSYGGNYKDLIIPLIPDNYNIDILYDRELPHHWTKFDIINIINNATPHIINHDGHAYYGYNLRMLNRDVDLLENDNYFFVYSHGCMAGGFDNPDGYECIAERLTVETPHGAFAVIMNARYGLGSEDSLDSPSQALDKSFFKALFTEDKRQLGIASHYSKEDNIWHINENGIRWVYYETNLFGDPEVSIKDQYPSDVVLTINITHPQNDNLLYFLNNKICSIPFVDVPIIIGKINVKVEASSNPEGQIYCVEFFIDNESQDFDYGAPFEWELDIHLIGKHTISAQVHGLHGENESEDFEIITFIPKKQTS